jgi:hypothetical protein
MLPAPSSKDPDRARSRHPVAESATQAALNAEIEARDARARQAQEALLASHPRLASARTDEIRRTLLLAERSALELALHRARSAPALP